jgi:hypothetical protein
MVRHFPWASEVSEEQKGEIADALYQHVRNPLIHRLGIAAPGQPDPPLRKSALSRAQIAALEDLGAPPPPAPPIKDDSFDVNVASLYWAVIRMLHALACDVSEMQAAQERLARKHRKGAKAAQKRRDATETKVSP